MTEITDLESKNEIVRNDKGYIKLMKMTKNYNWEIKAYEDMNKASFEDLLKKLDELNNLMILKYGGIN